MEIIRANAMDAQNITTGEKRTILAIKGKDGKDGIDGGVSDVKINGTSVIDENHVADIPIATTSRDGVVRFNSAYGVGVSNGIPQVEPASTENINLRTQSRRPITTSNFDHAVETSMGDGKAPAWSEQHQANARTRMGAVGTAELETALSAKQDTLESAVNIKTVNGESLLGSGNIEIQGGGSNVSIADNDAGGVDITVGETTKTVASQDQVYNGYSKKNYTDDVALGRNNQLYPSDKFIVSDPIPMTPGTSYSWYNGLFSDLPATLSGYLCEYDEWGNEVEYWSARSAVRTITATTKVAYIRATFQKSNLAQGYNKIIIGDETIYEVSENGQVHIGLDEVSSYAFAAERLYNNTTTLTDEQKLKIETWLGLSENYLTTYNTTPYQVTEDYNPAHKKYVDGLVNELQLFKFPNATIIGEPTINNGQISGFSATSYLKFPFLVDFNSRPFEINMEFTTGSNVTNQENIFDSDFGLAFAVRNSRFVIAVSTNGTSWNLGEGVGTYTVLANTTYRVKLWWDRMTYHLSYSVDGGNTYTEDITKVGAFQPAPKQMYIGVGETFATVNNHFTGIINMNHCNLSINGQLIWQGMDDAGLATRLEIDMSNIDADGIAYINKLIETSPSVVKTELVQYTNSDITLKVNDSELQLVFAPSPSGSTYNVEAFFNHEHLFTSSGDYLIERLMNEDLAGEAGQVWGVIDENTVGWVDQSGGGDVPENVVTSETLENKTIWVGTKAEYDAIERKTNDIYIVTDEDSNCYGVGDTCPVYHNIWSGFITGSSKQIRWFIPVPKPIDTTKVTSATINGVFDIRRSGDGGYIKEDKSLNEMGASITVLHNGLYVVVNLDVADTVPNNTPVAVIANTANSVITFS